MRERKHIIAIVGESGSGKTLASQLLTGPGCKTIVSYTTRPMREGEVDGVDHWFVTEDRMPPKEEMCAYTLYSGYHYWTEWGQFKVSDPQPDNYFAYVIDEKGLLELFAKCDRRGFNIIPIKIVRTDRGDIEGSRKERDKERIHLKTDVYKYVIINEGTLEEFKQQIDSLYQYIKSQDLWQHQKTNL